MATHPLPEECARRLLGVFVRHFGLRQGDALLQNNLDAVWIKNRWHPNDLKNGLDYAIEQGWIEPLPGNQYKLTDTGFAAA